MTIRTHAKPPVFPRRTAAAPLVMAVLACAMPRTVGDEPAASVYSRRPDGAATAASAAPAEDAAAQAERIVASSLAVFTRASAVSLKIRQKARVGDRVLVGTGRYLQSGKGEEQRFRFDSTLTCDTETFELTEVSDGLFCWTHRHNGEEPATLQRVDVRRVRGKLATLKAADAADGTAYLGGLQRTLRLLRHWFRFSAATPGDLDGTPVWVVEGHWDPLYLLIVLPDLKDRATQPGGLSPADLPDGVPWSIRLSIGKADLVPRRIEWLAIPGKRPVAAAAPEPIGVMDLHDVELNGAVDATTFFYQPATEGLIDITEMYVNGLSLMR
ncbi:MAG: hypothetical protein K8S94_09820 [Planctomycetia bacterium]|nr:hypothetical protein [Planctomycetia bacterium]